MRKRSSYRPKSVNPEAWKIAVMGSRILSTERVPASVRVVEAAA